MITRKPLLQLSVLLVAGVALFAGGNALAAEKPAIPDNCTLTLNGYPTGYTIRVKPGTWPIRVPPPPGGDNSYTYTWKYEILGISGTGMSLAALTPVCKPDLGVSQVQGSTLNTVAVVPAAVPDTSTKNFGLWTKFDNVVKMSGITSSLGFEFKTPGDRFQVRTTTMQLRNGTAYYMCPGIAGPDCAPNQQYAVTGFTQFETDEIDPATGKPIMVCSKPNPVTGCDQFVDCATGDPIPPEHTLTEWSLVTGGTTMTPIQDASVPGAACVTFWVRTVGNQSLYGVSGGSVTKVWPR